jgi:hypothetical protein
MQGINVLDVVVQIPDSIYNNVMKITKRDCDIIIPMTIDNINNLMSKCFVYSLSNRNDLEAGKFIGNLAKTLVDLMSYKVNSIVIIDIEKQKIVNIKVFPNPRNVDLETFLKAIDLTSKVNNMDITMERVKI